MRHVGIGKAAQGQFRTFGFVKERPLSGFGLTDIIVNRFFLNHSVGCSFSISLQVGEMNTVSCVVKYVHCD